MSEPIIRPNEPDQILSETRAFWRKLGRSLLETSIQTVNDTAKQIIVVSGILEGLYLNAVTFADLPRPVTEPELIIVYSAPIILLLISLTLALLVFFPKEYTLNFNSSEASKLLFERLLSRKRLLMRIASAFLVMAIVSILIAVLTFLQR